MSNTTIQTKKGDTCPICRHAISSPNCWVRYHVRYGTVKLRRPQYDKAKKEDRWHEPYLHGEIVILACKYCNFAEFGARTEHFLTKKALSRLPYVLAYQKKYGIIL